MSENPSYKQLENNPVQNQKKRKVLFLCTGNAFRSPLAQEWASLHGVPSASAAVGNLSRHIYKEDSPIPEHVQYFLQKFDLASGLAKERIKKVDQEMVNNAFLIVALCEPEELPPIIDRNDPRLRIRTVPDVNRIGDYREYNDVFSALAAIVFSIIEEYISLNCPTPPDSPPINTIPRYSSPFNDGYCAPWDPYQEQSWHPSEF